IVIVVRRFIFFFSSRRRHTRSYGDWSSDVCSSDLTDGTGRGRRDRDAGARGGRAVGRRRQGDGRRRRVGDGHGERGRSGVQTREIGRASCRERVKILAEAVLREVKMYVRSIQTRRS